MVGYSDKRDAFKAFTVMADNRLLSTAMGSSDDSNWFVHFLMLYLHDVSDHPLDKYFVMAVAHNE